MYKFYVLFAIFYSFHEHECWWSNKIDLNKWFLVDKIYNYLSELKVFNPMAAFMTISK